MIKVLPDDLVKRVMNARVILRREERVDGYGPVDPFRRGLSEWLGLDQTADIVDEYGQMQVLHAFHQVGNFPVSRRRGVADEHPEVGLGELGFEGALNGGEFGRVAPVQDDFEVVGGEFAREAQPDAVAGARDEGPGLRAVVVLGEGGGARVEVDEAEESLGDVEGYGYI